MRLKIIQINIWKGKFLDNLIDFLRKETPDIITMQEVIMTGNFSKDSLFSILEGELGLKGRFASVSKSYDGNSYLGNAVYTCGEIISGKTVWLKDYNDNIVESEKDWVNSPRNALDVKIEMEGKELHVISTHLAWTREPVDTPEKLRQAKILAEHIKILKLHNEPFLLCGDFNMPPNTQVIKIIDSVAHNATISKIKRSTHPFLHKTSSFLPEGLLVDYIYASNHFKVKEIYAPLVDISDHLPICAVVDFIIAEDENFSTRNPLIAQETQGWT